MNDDLVVIVGLGVGSGLAGKGLGGTTSEKVWGVTEVDAAGGGGIGVTGREGWWRSRW